MANSVIRYESHGFWVSDLYLEVLYTLILREMNSVNTNSNDNIKFFDEIFKLGISGYLPGAIDFEMEKFNDSQMKEFKTFLLKVYGNLITIPILFDNELNELRNSVLNTNEIFFDFDFIESTMIKKLILFTLLLTDKNLNISPKDEVNYW